MASVIGPFVEITFQEESLSKNACSKVGHQLVSENKLNLPISISRLITQTKHESMCQYISNVKDPCLCGCK